MKIFNLFLSRQFFQLAFLVLSFCSVNSFAQKSDAVAGKEKEKTDPARPRLIAVITNKPEKTEEKVSPAMPLVELVKTPDIVNQLERKAFEIFNQKRKDAGLPTIAWSDEMAKVARLHSENMAKFKFFSHAGLDGSMVNDRADLLGYSNWRAIGENIAYNRGYDNPVEFAFQRWMQSQSHKENILNPRWKEAGIGVAVTVEGTYYFTQVFVVKY